jgi:hypothetical protein
LFSNDKQALTEIINELTSGSTDVEVETIDCAINACWEADIIILAFAKEDYYEVPNLKEVARGKMVLVFETDAALNYHEVYSVTNKQVDQELQELLPYSHLIHISNSDGGIQIQKPHSNSNPLYAITGGKSDQKVNEPLTDLLRKLGIIYVTQENHLFRTLEN